MSKCHIFGNLMHWLKAYISAVVRGSRRFCQGSPDNFVLSSKYFIEGRTDLLREAVGPKESI